MSPQKAAPEFTTVGDKDGDGVADDQDNVDDSNVDPAVGVDTNPRSGPEARRSEQAKASTVTEALYGSASVPATGSSEPVDPNAPRPDQTLPEDLEDVDDSDIEDDEGDDAPTREAKAEERKRRAEERKAKTDAAKAAGQAKASAAKDKSKS